MSSEEFPPNESDTRTPLTPSTPPPVHSHKRAPSRVSFREDVGRSPIISHHKNHPAIYLPPEEPILRGAQSSPAIRATPGGAERGNYGATRTPRPQPAIPGRTKQNTQRQRRGYQPSHEEVAQFEKKRLSVQCIANQFQLDAIRTHYVRHATAITPYQNVLRLHLNDAEDPDEEVIVFSYGAVVFWNCSELREQTLIGELEHFAVEVLQHVESDELEYSLEITEPDPLGQKSMPSLGNAPEGKVENFSAEEKRRLRLRIRHDYLVLSQNDLVLKVAISYAFAQSIKLAVFEYNILQIVNKNNELVTSLANTGTIPLSTRDISQRLGRLMLQKNMVNLQTDILDTPTFFWENEEVRAEYQVMKNYLETKQRTDVLNHRMRVIQEMFDLLLTEQSNRHGTKLELLVLAVIVAQMTMELIQLIIEFVAM